MPLLPARPALPALRGLPPPDPLDPAALEVSPELSTLRQLAPPPSPFAPQQPQLKPGGPLPQFRTSLVLNPERLDATVGYAVQRIAEMKREMGLDESGRVIPGTWMAIRDRNERSFANDYSWRVQEVGGIFVKSNFSLGINTRHVRYISAKVQDDLLGTSPFFSAAALKPGKSKLAGQLEDFIQNEIERSNVRAALREGQKTALIVNESVMKTTYRRDVSTFTGPATVMVGADGQPVRTPPRNPQDPNDKGELIFEDDNFFPHPAVEGLVILEKNPAFTMQPGQFTFQYFQDLEQTYALYDNVQVETVDFRCFLCPLRVSDIHKADIVVHLYKATADELRERYAGIDVSDEYLSWWDLTGDQAPRHIQGETDEHFSSIVNKITVAECYLRFNATGTGKAQEILLVLDVHNKKPIFYDFLANHFSKRPFEVIPGLERVDKRWYGRGVFSLGEDMELHSDAEFNRAQIKGSRSSSVTFRVPEAVDEWAAGGPTVIGTDDIFNLKAGYDQKNPPIFKVNLAEENGEAIQLMEISRQASDSVIGIVSSGDASQSDMNQSKTATGILNLQASGDVITKATEALQAEAINAVLWQVVDCRLENMNHSVLILSKDATELITLNREEIRSLDRDVKLLLTRSRSTQLFSTSQQALQIASAYFDLTQTNPAKALALRSLVISQLKALEINDADDLCPEVTPEQVAAFQQQQQLAAAAQQQLQLPAPTKAS